MTFPELPCKRCIKYINNNESLDKRQLCKGKDPICPHCGLYYFSLSKYYKNAYIDLCNKIHGG